MGGKEQGWSRHNEEGIFRDFQAEADRLSATARTFGYLQIIYDNEFIESLNFRNSHDFILNKVSFGFAYKAICLWDAVKKANYGDFILMVDSNHIINCQLDPIIKMTLKNDIFLWDHNVPNEKQVFCRNGYWTKRATFIQMNCDGSEFWNAPQIQANVIGVIKSQRSLQFARQFFAYSLTPNVLFGIGEETQFDGFQHHRHDQSILTNLAVKFQIPVLCRYLNPWADEMLPELSPIQTNLSSNQQFRDRDLPFLK